MSAMDFSFDPWKLINLYFKQAHLARLVSHQIESYNEFVETQLEKTIEMFNPIKIMSENDYDMTLKKYKLEVHITVQNLVIYRAQIFENNGATKLMFPSEARLRNFTYSSQMTCDFNVKYIIRTGDQLENIKIENQIFKKINIGRIPIMLKSNICILNHYKNNSADITGESKYDPGGYFIINGSEKTVINQERTAENIPFYFKTQKNSKWLYVAEIKSVPDDKIISPKQITIMISKKDKGFGNSIMIQIPRIKIPVPLFIVFRALGIETDKDICAYIVLNIRDCSDVLLNTLKSSIIEANEIMTQEAALQYLKKYVTFIPINMTVSQAEEKKTKFLDDILKTDLLPHCKTKKRKLYLLGHMVNNLIKTSYGIYPQTDRDSYKNKRLDTCGSLLNNLFRNYYNKFVKDITKLVIKEINIGSWRSTLDYEKIINTTNIYKIVKSLTIENGFKRALSTGDFGIKHYNSNKVGVAQVLNRMTYVSALSHLRRANTPIDKSGRLIEPRKMHNTSYGYICAAETPEGHSVGIVKNLAYMTHITIPCENQMIYETLEKETHSLDELEPHEVYNKVKVMVNGQWIGITENPLECYRNLKERKYAGIINIYASVVFDYKNKEILVNTDAGRLTRPLLKVNENKLQLDKEQWDKINEGNVTWLDLLINKKSTKSIIEYIDPLEQNASLIAMDTTHLRKDDKKYRWTHCEIHPSTLFGILASCIPFPDHNQSPRNTYQCAMGKQAMGMYVTNYEKRMDKTSYVLNYSTRPLVDTRVMNMLKLNVVPSGSQVIVAIMCHTGYNQEDSILINKGSIERGLFQATIYHTEKDEDRKLNGCQELRQKPNKKITKGIKFGNYEKINSQGVINENEKIDNLDILIAKIVTIKNTKNDPQSVIKYHDESKIFRTNEDVYVDKNLICRNGDGYSICKVRTRTLRQPKIGDKFSSRHGQKGTVGNIIPEENMPFTENGLKPDIIINPHAIPSRMTIAQLKETLLGKVLLELGLFGDGTSFTNLKLETIVKELSNLGYHSQGNEVMYNGETGEQIDTSIFIGPVYYQRLKHMTNDKVHSRSIGPMVSMTRQPLEGRCREGGLRFGEMERDCIFSHGASRFAQDRLYYCSDKYNVTVCNKCGLIIPFNEKAGITLCKTCDNRADFSHINMPYACKLLIHELMTMAILPRIIAN